MLRIYTILMMTMLIGCQRVADKFVYEEQLPTVTNTIASLREDVVMAGGFTITDDIVVEGRVTSSDIEDNLYGSLVVEDDSGAVEVRIGSVNLSARYPEGLLVALRVMGCHADYSYGVLQIGSEAPEYEMYGVGNLASPERVDAVVVRSADVKPIEPQQCSISELRRTMCGRLVEVRGLCLTDSSSIDTLAGEGLDRARWQGYSLFKDARGDSIAVYTLDYARYAEHRIPTDSVNIVGILQWNSYRDGEECYLLRMRYEADYTLY